MIIISEKSRNFGFNYLEKIFCFREKIFYVVSDHKNWGETGGEVGLQAAKRIMIIRHVVAENQVPEAGPKISISGYLRFRRRMHR